MTTKRADRPDSRTAESRNRAWALASSVVLVAGVVSITGFALSTIYVSDAILAGLLVGVVISTTAAGVYLAIFVSTRTRYSDLRLALTGGPRVGKTVFANLLLERLMFSSDSSARFTADAATALSVYQTIRGIDDGMWPAATVSTHVFKYAGVVRYGPRGILDIEIGDSAGEHWLNVEQAQGGLEPGEAPYLEYVVSSSGLIHVIPINELLADAPARIRLEVRDLQVAAQLAASVHGPDNKLSLLVVLSKADLLRGHGGLIDSNVPTAVREAAVEGTIWTPSDIYDLMNVRGTLRDSLRLFVRALESLADTYEQIDIMFSGIFDTTTSGTTRKANRREELPDVVGWLVNIGTAHQATTSTISALANRYRPRRY